MSYLRYLTLLSLAAAQTILVDGTSGAGSFEGAGTVCPTGTVTYQGWTIVNGSQTNRWAVNTAAGAQHGTQAIYITNNCGGGPPPYAYTVSSSSVVHFYRDVTLPAGEPYLTLSAYIKVRGENNYDYLDIFVAPTSVTPTAGVEVPATYRLARYSMFSSNWTQVSVNFCGTAGQTYRVIFSWRNDGSVGTQPPAAVDRVHIVSNSTPPPPLPGVVNVPALPYTHGADNTCGKGNKFTSTNTPVCGSSNYYGGEDMMWVFTPTTSGIVTVSLTSSTTYTGLMVYQGGALSPCGGLTGATCVAQAQSSTGDKTLCFAVTAGQTYYLQLDYWPSPTCGPFSNLTISAPVAPGPCTGLGSGITTVTTLPYNSGAGTTCGAGDDITSSNALPCGSSSYFTGEDRVWVFTPSSSGAVTISLTHSNASSPWFGLKVYQGCPVGCNRGVCLCTSESASGPYSVSINVTAGQTYYVVLDHFANPTCAAYDNLSISAPVAGVGPCSAPLFTSYPVVTTGTTSGAPPLGVSPTCLSGGNCGVVGRWYAFVATAPNMTVHVAPGTLSDPAVAVYSAPSCSGPFTQIACNDDGAGCESSPRFAQVTLTGLTVGQTYYVAVVAGSGGGAGDYTLAIWETASAPPSQYGQDCEAVPGNPASGPLPVCSSTFSVGAPGFLGPGFTCDLPYPAGGCPASCLTSGERNFVWIRLPISANGNLSFAITPSTNVDYDWTLYRIDNVANPCQAIRNGTINPVRCSFDAPTSCDGTYGTGVACGTPACASGTCEGAGGQGWLQCLPVNAGEVYLLGISNFSTTTFPGFTVDFGASPIDYAAGSATAVWTGGAGTTAWNNNANWGGCPFPNSCTRDVIIYGGSANQPVIAAAETWTVRDITVPVGASLTVNGILNVCGHLTVNGDLQGTGWIVFTGGVAYPVQEIRGVLMGATQYIPNLRVQRGAVGEVRLMTNVQVRSTVEIVSGANNTLNLNGRRLFVGGNVVVGNAAATLSAPANSFLIFNGSAPQTYTDPGSDPLFNVEVNQTAPSTVTLNNTMRILGTLTLTSGRLVAPVSGTREVRVENTAPAAVSPGNANSFVVGYLRRFLNNTGGSYDFPMGLNAPVRYARINLNFSGNPGVHNLLATFTGWGGGPPTPSGSPVTECGANYGTCPLLDNGYWTITGWQADLTTQVTTSGPYTATLYNTDYNPCTGAQQWGVLKNNGSAGNGADWFIQNPGCHANTAPAAPGVVSRPGMSGFSHFGTGQSTLPLPVVIQAFEGKVVGEDHLLSWQVAEIEGGRVRHFTLEAGPTPDKLKPLTTLPRHTSSWLRRNPPYGTSFYRLRIQTEEGAEVVSSMVELRRDLSEGRSPTLQVFPNPTTGEVTLRFVMEGPGPVRLTLYNALGQRVRFEERSDLLPGVVELSWSLAGLPSGLYLLTVESGGTFQQATLRKD